MKLTKKNKLIIVRTFFNTFIISSLILLTLSFGPFIQYELGYRLFNAYGKKYVISDSGKSDNNMFTDIFSSDSNIYIKPQSYSFSVLIPKIGLNERIIDVNSGDANAVTNTLKNSVGRAIGTSYPDQNGNMYLFAHSSLSALSIDRYNAVFTLIRNLDKGDLVYIYYKDNVYTYQVYDKYIVSAEDTKDITYKSSFPELTLQTCDPPGFNINRMLVKARKI